MTKVKESVLLEGKEQPITHGGHLKLKKNLNPQFLYDMHMKEVKVFLGWGEDDDEGPGWKD